MTNVYEVKIVRITEEGVQSPVEPIAEGLEFSLNNERFFAQCSGEYVKYWGEAGKDINVKVKLGFIDFGLSKSKEHKKKLTPWGQHGTDHYYLIGKILEKYPYYNMRGESDPNQETLIVDIGKFSVKISAIKKGDFRVGDYIQTKGILHISKAISGDKQ